MKRLCAATLWCGIVVFLGSAALAHAAEWRFPLGLSYIGGLDDVADLYKDNIDRSTAYTVSDTLTLPVGIAFQPYLEFEGGMGVGMGVGPAQVVLIRGKDGSPDYSFYNVPVSAELRYSFLPGGGISPYLRGGVLYHIADGDYLESSSVGFVARAGMELSRKGSRRWGIEVSVDTAELTFTRYSSSSGATRKSSEKIRPLGFSVSLFIVL
ncbi:MAG TPA: hypothetical protein ENJ37_07320 [Deltaproteobacteria bacterium]|nr:hypothetical protein [Deltaproteobacteria bacterium]